jgi:hypothetical protein
MIELAEDSPETDADVLPEAPKAPGWYATTSQRRGLQKLNAVAEVFVRNGNDSKGGFAPNLKCLLLGGSGTGKSSLARQFSLQRKWPHLSIDSGSWIPLGAYTKPATLKVIRDFVRANARGTIFLDEVCKLLPRGSDSRNSWTLSVFSEALALYDGLSGDDRLLTHEWTKDDLAKYRDFFFLISGGAFQDAYREVQADRQRGTLGFLPVEPPKLNHGEQIAHSQHLPDEISSRFNPDFITLEAPTREDYAEGIKRIHQGLGIKRSRPLKILLDEASASGSGVRWLTTYMTRVMVENPGASPAKEAQASPRKPKTYDFFAQDTTHHVRRVNDYSFALRAVLMRLSTELVIHKAAVESDPDRFFRHFLSLDGEPCGLPELVLKAMSCCAVCADISGDDNGVKVLAEFQAKTWIGLRQYPAKLTDFRLFHLFLKGWDLSSRIVDLRTRLSAEVAHGRYDS